MPPKNRFSYLVDGGPEDIGPVVADYASRLLTSDLPLEPPHLMLMVYDPDHEVPFMPVLLPYTDENVLALGGKRPRGRIGTMIANIAMGFHLTPPDLLRKTAPYWEPQHRLLYVAVAAEIVRTPGDIPDYISDFEQDVPLEAQHSERMLMACDGRGYLYAINSPDTGISGPPLMSVTRCDADIDRPGKFLHPPEEGNIGGIMPWGLDMLARGYRKVFETGPTPCPSTRPKKPHSRKISRRKRS